jgi:hypothetical protein
MDLMTRLFLLAPAILRGTGVVRDDEYVHPMTLFKNVRDRNGVAFFVKSYGYALFPVVIAGSPSSKGRVYAHGQHIGDTTMTESSAAAQESRISHSQIIFFEHKRALQEFKSGSFEFVGEASAVAAGAQVNLGATGTISSADDEKRDAADGGGYRKGMAVFTLAEGGLPHVARIASGRFTYAARRRR